MGGLRQVGSTAPFSTSLRPRFPLFRTPADPKTKVTILNSTLPDAAKLKFCPSGAATLGFTLISAAGAAPRAPAAAGPAAAATRRRSLLAAPAAPPAAPPGTELLDGFEERRVAVTGMESMCGGGALLFVDQVPQPCGFPELKSDAEVDAILASRNAPSNSARGRRGAAAAAALLGPLLAAAVVAL
jgi:hypothetical protein